MLPIVSVTMLLLSGLSVFSGVHYGARVAGGKHDLDVYAPPVARSLPVIVFFHGGGLQAGDRAQYRTLGRALALQGYVVVIPSYRLYPMVRVRSSVADAAGVVVWTAHHIARFGGSPEKIVLVGHSAGGYLSAILAFDPRYLTRLGASPDVIRGIFELSADYSNRDPDPAETAKDIAIDHHIYGETAEERDANSVYRYLHKTVPFEATCESIDPGTQCVDRDHFVALLRGYGSAVRSFTEKNASHEALVRRVGRPGDPLNTELRRFIAWVSAHA
ncbi:MAG: alpha/beta hydrolase [Candidatus Eremiobacteraeota bacterium]|nr:alpha/beta hydrolase [Candidatus Eremiobacteraeota bacterium]